MAFWFGFYELVTLNREKLLSFIKVDYVKEKPDFQIQTFYIIISAVIWQKDYCHKLNQNTNNAKSLKPLPFETLIGQYTG